MAENSVASILSIEDQLADVLDPPKPDQPIYRNIDSTLLTNFNKSPYYDDYNIESNYHRLLFRPGYAVQARELTQIQSVLQDQINRFGKHVFDEGSIVLGGQFVYENRMPFVKIKDQDSNGNDLLNIYDYVGKYIYDPNINLYAKIYKVAEGSESDPDGIRKTFYVNYYNSGGAEGEIKEFQPNSTLVVVNDVREEGGVLIPGDENYGTVVVEISITQPTGFGSIFLIREGVFFAKNHFIAFKTQSVILDRYGQNPRKRVGFKVLETISRYTDDLSLLDPALESSNYSAPGADRLKLTPILTVLPIEEDPGPPDYVDLFVIDNGVIQESNERTIYSRIGDEFAKRTFDESGDYYVRGLNVRVREHLDNEINNGWLPASQGGDSNLLAVGVEPGLAYVKGYEVGQLVTKYVTIPKSNAFVSVTSQISSSSLGNYFICNEFAGAWVHDIGAKVTLYNSPAKAITNKTYSSTSAPTGAIVGTARIKAVEHESGLIGTPKGLVRIYLFDIQINLGYALSDTRCLYASSSSTNPTNIFADVVLENGSAFLRDTSEPVLLYKTGAGATRSVDPFTASYTHKRSESGTAAAGIITINTKDSGGSLEIFAYGPGSFLGTDEKREIIVTAVSPFTVNLPGTASIAAGSDTVVGSVTARFDFLNPGDKIAIGGGTAYYIDQILSPTTARITETVAAGVSSGALTKVYFAGDTLDLTARGSASGIERTVQQIGTTQLQIDLKESISQSVYVSYRVARPEGGTKQIPKQLKSDRFVIIDCSAGKSGVSGPYNLGVPDVYQIKYVKKYSSTPTDENGVDVTSQFVLDNGQKDELYDHATITPKTPLSPSDFLLVKLDYFHPDVYTDLYSVGYFSVDSYPVNDAVGVSSTTIKTQDILFYKSKATGELYDLRNCLDFRPVKTPNTTISEATSISAAATAISPAKTDTFLNNGGLRLPAPDSTIEYDYSHYLARRDIIAMDRFGTIKVVTGTPAVGPVSPSVPENLMALANIFLPPYPSLSPYYAKKESRNDLSCTVRRMSHIRYTMRDIGVLKNRIDNLEYYVALNQLEKDAVDMLIPDEQGLNRFKNGIFTDNFRDHTLGATNRTDYKISVDPDETSIRPIFDNHSIYYDLVEGSNVNTRLTHGKYLTLDYEEIPFLEQSAVTTYRNNETSIYKYVGTLLLDPDTDVWTNTNEAPEDLNISFGSDQEDSVSAIEWGCWKKSVVGYKVYRQWNNELLGTYTTEAEAKAAAVNFAGKYKPKKQAGLNTKLDVYIETAYDNTRTGTQDITTVTSQTQSLGDRIIDAQLVPYIRPQTIRFYASGMKPSTKLYLYFDNEEMTKYATQTMPNWASISIDQLCQVQWSDPPKIVCRPKDGPSIGGWPDTNKEEGQGLKTNERGEIWGTLRIPSEKEGKLFRVGTKELKLTDSPMNDETATTVSYEYFVSHGLKVTKQDTILTTRTVVQSEKDVSESFQSKTQQVVKSQSYDSCSAYTFLVKAPEKEEGLFITSVDVWIAGLDPNDGLWFEIREMSSDGGIKRTQVPLTCVKYSSSSLEPYVLTLEEVNAAPTEAAKRALFESKKFRVKFPAPVFLYNNVQYAFVMHTIGPNYNTYFWSSKIGQTDVITGNQITSRILTGTLFATNNNLNWDEVTGWDLKVRFNRAKFKTNVDGVAIIGNENYERLRIGEVSSTANMKPGVPIRCHSMTFDPVDPQGCGLNDIIKMDCNFVAQTTMVITYVNTFTNQTITTYQNVTCNIISTGNGKNNFCLKPPKCEVRDCDDDGPDRRSKPDYDKKDKDKDKDDAPWCKVGKYDKVKYEYPKMLGNNKIIKICHKSNGNPVINVSTGKKWECEIKNYKKKEAKHDRFCDKEGKRKKKPKDDCTVISQNVKVNVITSNVIVWSNTIVITNVITGNYVCDCSDSTGDFDANDVCYLDDGSETILTVREAEGFVYDVMNFQPSFLDFNKCSIKWAHKTTKNGSLPMLSSTFTPFNDADDYYFDTQQVLLSKTQEAKYLGAKKSNQILITMRTDTDYLSPMIDLCRTHSIFVHNIVNSDFSDEEAPVGGKLINKYITRTMTLAEGQDAEDIKVMLSTYRPTGTDVAVYVKIRHDEDIDTIDQKDWVRLVKPGEGETIYSSLADKDDWIDYEFDFPDDVYVNYLTIPIANVANVTGLSNPKPTIDVGYRIEQVANSSNGTRYNAFVTGVRTGEIYLTNGFMYIANTKANTANIYDTNGTLVANGRITGVGVSAHGNSDNNGVVEYTTQSGITFTGYKQFSVKVALASDNSAVIPRVGDIRVIALQR